MSSIKAFTVLAILACGAAQAAPIACPAFVADHGVAHPLDDASVFDGPPSELADLVPTDAGWNLTSYKNSPRPLFLVCKYRKSAVTQTVEIPKGLSGCTIGQHAGTTQIGCE